MSTPAFVWALECGATLDLLPADRLVLIVLAKMANGERVCWPGQPTIERFTGLKNNTVRAALRRLVSAQLLRVEATPGRVAKYHILCPPPANGEGITPANQHGVTPANGHMVTPSNGDGVPPQNSIGSAHQPPQMGMDTPANGHNELTKKGRKNTFLTECDAAGAASLSPRDELWRDGVPLVQRLLGVMDRGAQSFLGKLLKVAADDCARVLQLLRQAEQQRPLDPASWLMANARPFRNAGLAVIDDEGSSLVSEGAAAMQRMLLAAEAKGHG